MRRKIINPYNPQLNKCFGCSKTNPIGLKMEFEEVDNYIMAVWEPKEYYQGYINVLHGGIIATLLDEAGAWCVTVKMGTAGVTSELKVRYLKPVFMNRGNINIKARILKVEDRHVYLKCELTDGNGKICAESEAVFFTYPEEIAKRKFGFPGKEQFFEK
ncbi:MAG TPA: PaaI family thioesterase [Bacteroidales bacterium]|nr:PaaI family thioesterase [Bacteroidales bacterium]